MGAPPGSVPALREGTNLVRFAGQRLTLFVTLTDPLTR